MKNSLKMLLSVVALTILCLQVMGQNFPEVISVRKIELKEGVNPGGFYNSVAKMSRGLQKHSRGASVKLLAGDRGERTQQLLHMWTFEYKASRDYYFPTSDAEEYPQLGALIADMGISVTPNDPRVKSGMDVYTDYVVVGYSDIINPKAGEILAFREIDVLPENQSEFEAFVKSDFHPAVQKNIEGLYAYVLKGDRGERKGKYLLIQCFDSINRRDTYFPAEGGESAEEYVQQAQSLREMNQTFISFLKEGSGSVFTDYIVIN